MEMTQILAQTGGLRSMARELGVTEKEVRSAAAALVPAILGGFKKQAQSQPTGLEPRGRAERGCGVRARTFSAQADAADACDAHRRLHGEAAGHGRREVRRDARLGRRE